MCIYIYIYLSIHVLKGKSCVGECLALIWKDLANYVVLYIYINIHKLLPMHKFKTSNGMPSELPAVSLPVQVQPAS